MPRCEKTVIVQCRAQEIFDDPDGPRLIEEYSAECAIALVGKPAPRRDMYENLEACGMGHCFAAYESCDRDSHAGQRCKLVGFAMLLIAVVPHYSLSMGNLESLFVTQGSHCGLELMAAVEAYAKAQGCTAVGYSAPVGSRLARLLFLQEGKYMHTSHVFARRLDG